MSLIQELKIFIYVIFLFVYMSACIVRESLKNYRIFFDEICHDDI